MTLRIFVETQSAGRVVALHGWLSAAEVEAVDKALTELGPSSRVDLAHLTGIDPVGLEALRRLKESGTPIEGASSYMSLLLEPRVVAGRGEPEK